LVAFDGLAFHVFSRGVKKVPRSSFVMGDIGLNLFIEVLSILEDTLFLSVSLCGGLFLVHTAG
jgi:hypothetical protein